MSELHSIPAPCAAGLKAETEAALLRTYIAGYGGPLDHFDARLDRTIGMARLMFEATDNADHFDFELSTSGIKCGLLLLQQELEGINALWAILQPFVFDGIRSARSVSSPEV
ncbi:MAG TPA: hypothetical protein DCQ20_09010 [Nitrospira sp.]|nr:hypothetical protein [Nitrospira sp.]